MILTALRGHDESGNELALMNESPNRNALVMQQRLSDGGLDTVRDDLLLWDKLPKALANGDWSDRSAPPGH
jgi:hypothetical protein